MVVLEGDTMTEAIAFDTHRFVKNLTASGFTEQQAEVLANEQVNLLNSNLATKVDIAALKVDITALKADIAASKVELLKWMIGAMVVQTGVIVALVKLL